MSHDDSGRQPDPYQQQPGQHGGRQPGGEPGQEPRQPLPEQPPSPYASPQQPPQQAQPYPQPQQPPYPPPYQQQPYQQPYSSPSAGTDGFSVAALVTGILGMGIVPIVLGIVGLSRVRRTGQSGKGMSIAGIVLGAIAIVVWTVLLVLGIAFFSEMDRQGVWDDLDDGTYGSSVVLDASSGPVTTG